MEVKRRGRGPNLPGEIKESIALMRHNDPKKWTSKQLQKFWSGHLQDPSFVKATFKEDKWKYYKFPKGYPSLRAMDEEVGRQNKIKKEHPEIEEFDKPWSLGAVDKNPDLFPPEGITAILRVWKWGIEIGGFPRVSIRVLWAIQKLYPNEFKEVPEIMSKIPRGYLSIRDAKWIARLSSAIPAIDRLEMIATLYSDLERISLLTSKVFDSAGVDEDFLIEEFSQKNGFATKLKDYLKKEEAQNEGKHNTEG
jgi:hypothetical protein